MCSSVAVTSCLHLLKEIKLLVFSEYFSKFPAVIWKPELLFDALMIYMFLTPGDINI